jgi:L-lysine exporter family protein LysE/ArgO
MEGNLKVFITFMTSSFFAGALLGFSLIIAIGPQNAHVLRMGLQRRFVFTTVLACALTDWVLIGIGVGGFASMRSMAPWLMKLLLIAALLFLLYYGWLGFRRAMRSSVALAFDASGTAATQGLPRTFQQAALTALAFSWLNPHAWLDTAVLVGGASLRFSAPQNWWFGIGAATASTVWFVGLGGAASALSPWLAKPLTWRFIDASIALTMWVTAGFVAKELLAL